MGNVWVLYKNKAITKLVKRGIKQVDKFLIFKLEGKYRVVLKSNDPERVPVFLGVKQLYYVEENDQNTFDIWTGSILEKHLSKDWIKYLNEHPESRQLTKEPKKPETAPPHHIIEDIAHVSLNGQVLKNLISKVKGQMLNEFLFPFLAGMGGGIILLVIISAISPDNVYIRLGKP